MAEKTSKYGKWMLTAAAVLWCVVIWQFSLTPADASSATSGTVGAFMNGTLAAMGVSFRFTPIMVRKIAHFTEFFVLGVLPRCLTCCWIPPAHFAEWSFCGAFGGWPYI